MSKVVVVVPCYNEEQRLDADALLTLLEDPTVHLLLVNDGSSDGTRALIEAIALRRPDRVRALSLERNSGKAEAVRVGLREGLASGAGIVGYLDADLATPPDETLRLLAEMRKNGAKVAFGARVRLLGRQVDRHPVRHYLGRVFATAASGTLRLSVYDTQCGAKFFADGEALRHALDKRFMSRWVFDVELFQRLLKAPKNPIEPAQFLEYPLLVWKDRAGSKLTAGAMLRAGVDLLRIGASGFVGERRKKPE